MTGRIRAMRQYSLSRVVSGEECAIKIDDRFCEIRKEDKPNDPKSRYAVTGHEFLSDKISRVVECFTGVILEITNTNQHNLSAKN